MTACFHIWDFPTTSCQSTFPKTSCTTSSSEKVHGLLRSQGACSSRKGYRGIHHRHCQLSTVWWYRECVQQSHQLIYYRPRPLQYLEGKLSDFGVNHKAAWEHQLATQECTNDRGDKKSGHLSQQLYREECHPPQFFPWLQTGYSSTASIQYNQEGTQA